MDRLPRTNNLQPEFLMLMAKIRKVTCEAGSIRRWIKGRIWQNNDLVLVAWLLWGLSLYKEAAFCLYLRGHHQPADSKWGTAVNRSGLFYTGEKLKLLGMFSAYHICGSYLQIRRLQSPDVGQQAPAYEIYTRTKRITSSQKKIVNVLPLLCFLVCKLVWLSLFSQI